MNAAYSPTANTAHAAWSIPDSSVDMVTALSVWTHFNEADAIFYFSEINRVLKPSGKAILTFFLLDEGYERSLARRSEARSPYHKTPSQTWIFDQSSSPSGNWKHPGWVSVAENAVGVTPAGVRRLLDNTDLRWDSTYPGNWKEHFGLYFQDILVFSKL
jgi:SAM-dependent methyltransferase